MTAPRRRQLFNIDIDPNLVDMSGSKILAAVREQSNTPVSEIMQPIVATLAHDDLLAKIIYKMLSHNQSLMPVLKDEKVVGVVRSVDAFHEVVTKLL
jgi:predicted transcriptional regulator